MHFGAIILGRTRAADEAAFEAARNGIPALLMPEAGHEGGSDPMPEEGEQVAQFQDAIARSVETGAWATNGSGSRTGDSALSTIRRTLGEFNLLRSDRRTHRLEQAGVVIDRSSSVALRPEGGISTGSGDLHDAPVIVVATGDRPRRPRRFAFDDEIICDARSILRIDRRPRTLLVIGADSAGCEIACLFAALGSTVTIVDRRSRSLRYVDRDLLEVLHTHMRAMGIDLVLDESIEDVTVHRACREPHATVRLGSGRVEICDRIVVVAGSEPACAGLGLDRAGVAVDENGFVVVDEFGRTSRPGVYAAGAVVSCLGGYAEAQQGRLAIRDALALARVVEQPVPLTIHTIPEIAMIGITEEVCTRLDVPHVTATVSFDEITWGQVRNGPGGLLKIVARRGTGEILGVQVIGRDARDLIHLGGLVMRQAGTLEQLADTIFSSTSASEAYWVAAIRGIERLAADDSSKGDQSIAPG